MSFGSTVNCGRIRLAAALLAAATGAASALAQPGSSDREALLRTIDADALAGQLVSLSLTDGATIRTEADGSVRIPTQDLVRLTLSDALPTAVTDRTTVTLSGGDWIAGRIVAGGPDAVTLETVALGNVQLPLDAVASVRTDKANQPAYRASVTWFERSTPIDQDAVLLTNGDVASGFVTAVDADALVIDGSLGEARIPMARVLAIRLSTGKPAQPSGPRFMLAVRRTGRLTATAFDLSGDTAEARLQQSQRVAVAADDILAVEVAGGRWEWLSATQPISYQHTPMLSLGWEYANDRNVLGKPIVVAGRRYEHGVGVHSRSSLIYDLMGKYVTFATSMGIDDDSGPRADVSVRILVDGKRRFDEQHITPGKLIGPIRIDVTKAKRLELIVDYGDNGDIQDRFNWVEAALVRKPNGE